MLSNRREDMDLAATQGSVLCQMLLRTNSPKYVVKVRRGHNLERLYAFVRHCGKAEHF